MSDTVIQYAICLRLLWAVNHQSHIGLIFWFNFYSLVFIIVSLLYIFIFYHHYYFCWDLCYTVICSEPHFNV